MVFLIFLLKTLIVDTCKNRLDEPVLTSTQIYVLSTKKCKIIIYQRWKNLLLHRDVLCNACKWWFNKDADQLHSNCRSASLF